LCFAAIPAGLTGPGAVVFGELAYNRPNDSLVTNFNFLFDRDTSTDPQAVWAKFTPAEPVPEPASLVLLGTGLSAAIVTLRRRKSAA
jgi:hypothetical protein